MRKLIKPLVIVAICLMLFGGCYLQQGGWMMNSPKYSEKRLLGLTSAQVVQQLGAPTHDPRVPFRSTTQPEWTSEASDGPLHLGYYQGWATCVIEFKNDHVVSVRRFYK